MLVLAWSDTAAGVDAPPPPAIAGKPKYKTPMLFVPVGGAGENVSVTPDTVYVLGFCTTPDIDTIIEVVLAGAYDIVNAVVVPLPLNWSNGNAAVEGAMPMYDNLYLRRFWGIPLGKPR